MSPDNHPPSAPRPPMAERPRLPDGYGQSRPEEPAGSRLPWRVVENWLVKSWHYWLTTTRPDGRPHAVPAWGIWRNGSPYFSTGPETVTAGNLILNPAALAHLPDGDQVSIIEGAVEGFTDWAGRAEFVAADEGKYDWRMDPDDPSTPATGRTRRPWRPRRTRPTRPG